MFKKLQVYIVSLSLILTICFPPVIKTVEAAPTLENSLYYVEVDELKGKASILNLIGGLVFDVEITFYESKLKNMTLKKLIQTDNGPMVVTMKSERLNELIEAGTLRIDARYIDFNEGKTLLTLPNLLVAGTVWEVKADIRELESSSIQINDLILDISFDPNEINQFLQKQRSLQQVDRKENLEETLLILDEMEGGNLSKQKEAFEAMVNDLPNQEVNVNKIAQMLNDLEQQRVEIDNKITELHVSLENEQQINDVDEQLQAVTLQFENYTASLNEVGEFINEVQEILTKYVEIVDLRAQYLKELGLIDWSESYKELLEVKQALHKIVSDLENQIEHFNGLTEQKSNYAESLNQLSDRITTLNDRPEEKNHKQSQEKSLKQLNEQLEEFQEQEPSLLETILEENEIDEDIDIEQIQEEFEAMLSTKAEELEGLAEDEEKQKEMAKAVKETLAQYTPVLIDYLESLNTQKKELEENNDGSTEQIVDLEIKISIIENIIARIEEFDEELSLLIE